jgi:hypothetical protein
MVVGIEEDEAGNDWILPKDNHVFNETRFRYFWE